MKWELMLQMKSPILHIISLWLLSELSLYDPGIQIGSESRHKKYFVWSWSLFILIADIPLNIQFLNILFLVHKLDERWSKHLFMDHIDIKYHYVIFSCSTNLLRNHWEQNIKARRQRNLSFMIEVIYNSWQFNLSCISALPKNQNSILVSYKDCLIW